MVFLHGYMSNKESFSSQIRFFSRYYRVIAPDFTGFGNSKKMEYPYALDDYVNEIKTLLNDLNVGEYDVIAHSFGARVALKLALADERLNKMVLTGAAGLKPRRGVKYYFNVYRYKFLKKFFPNKRLDGFGSPEYRSLNAIMKRSYVYVVNEHLDGYLSEIKNKTLVLSGSCDKQTPPYTQKRLNKKLPNSRVVFLKNEGHFAFATRPFDFNLIAREFLLGDN